MASENFGALRDERVRCLIENPDVAAPHEVRKLAQEVIDTRQTLVAAQLNAQAVVEQQAEIIRLRARVETLAKMVAETPVDELVERVRNLETSSRPVELTPASATILGLSRST